MLLVNIPAFAKLAGLPEESEAQPEPRPREELERENAELRAQVSRLEKTVLALQREADRTSDKLLALEDRFAVIGGRTSD